MDTLNTKLVLLNRPREAADGCADNAEEGDHHPWTFRDINAKDTDPIFLLQVTLDHA